MDKQCSRLLLTLFAVATLAGCQKHTLIKVTKTLPGGVKEDTEIQLGATHEYNAVTSTVEVSKSLIEAGKWTLETFGPKAKDWLIEAMQKAAKQEPVTLPDPAPVSANPAFKS